MVALPIFNRMRIISQTWVWEYNECLYSDYYYCVVTLTLTNTWGMDMCFETWHAFMFIYCTVIPFFPHQYIATMRIAFVIIIKYNDTGWVLFTRKVWRTFSVKSHVYDKNSIFIIPNLHRDAPFNLPPTALSPQAAQCTREMQHFCPDTCTEHPESLRALELSEDQRYVSNDPGILKAIFWDIYFAQIARTRLTTHQNCRLSLIIFHYLSRRRW